MHGEEDSHQQATSHTSESTLKDLAIEGVEGTAKVRGMNLFLNRIPEAATSNLLASHFTNLRGTSVFTNLRMQSAPNLWIPSICLGDKSLTTFRKNFPEYLLKVDDTGKSLDLFALLHKQKAQKAWLEKIDCYRTIPKNASLEKLSKVQKVDCHNHIITC